MEIRRALVCSLFLMLPLLGQAPASRPAPLPRLVSPDVQTDDRVTFRFRAPNAVKVTANRAGNKPLEMQKDEQGVWSVPTDPLEPDMYGYTFNVDGVGTVDPVNPLVAPNLMGPSSMVHVRGASSMPWDTTDVAHSTLHHHFFKSAVANDNRDMYVYTPAGYDPKSKAA